VAERLAASREGLSSVELVHFTIKTRNGSAVVGCKQEGGGACKLRVNWFETMASEE
jgi:hypothetical protein